VERRTLPTGLVVLAIHVRAAVRLIFTWTADALAIRIRVRRIRFLLAPMKLSTVQLAVVGAAAMATGRVIRTLVSSDGGRLS
jgi:hypothetical protein